MARSLSDIAAMGGTPCYALVSLAISRRISRAWIEEFYAGMVNLARRFGVTVVGGDTAVVSGSVFTDVIVAGEVPNGRALLRSGARPGDRLYVSGRLGMSALGLRLLQLGPGKSPRRRGPTRGRAARNATSHEALHAHLYPEPRCALGRFLSAKRLASALIDLSDGLSSDLSRLCEASGAGARLYADRIPAPAPPAETARRAVSADRAVSDALKLALHGGEDYELLFTVPPGKVSRLPQRFRGVELHEIGEVRSSPGIILVEPGGKARRLDPAGYDHFRPL